ncbi:MAG: diguanylate cyclase, partial [Actinomycetota bacterium]|nr:diguanylate cyclase [Actinomycetota bacterium]
MSSWIVLLEAAGSAVGRSIDIGHLRALAEVVNAEVALHSPQRYALQLRRPGSRPTDALDRALTQWEDAVSALGLAPWELVRAEVFAPDELERELGDAGGGGTRAVVAFTEKSDGPDEDEAEADELLDSIFRDPLTGLADEDGLRSRLPPALGRADHLGKSVALMLVDLDGFDAVNRNLGHGAGDQVLVRVAQRLSVALRPADTLARVEADRFGILLEDTWSDAAAAVGARIVAALRAPLEVEGQPVTLAASVGVALATPAQAAENLLGAAAAALAAAKAAGGNRWEMLSGQTREAGAERLDRQRRAHDRLSYVLLMQRAAVAANAANSLEEAAKVVLRQVCAHTSWQVGHLLVVAPERPEELVSSPIWHLPPNDRYRSFQASTQTARFPSGRGLPGRAFARAEPLWISDLSPASEPERATAAAQDGLRAGFAFPVLVGREVVGVLEFFSSEPAPPDGSLLDVLAAVGTQLGRVVERARAHDALRDSQALLREAQALGRLGSSHSDLTTGRTTWSDELYRILDVPAASIPPSADAFLAFVHPEDRELVEADARRLWTVGDPATALEFRVVRPDGEVRWVLRRSSLLRNHTEEPVAVNATVQDITEYKRTAECSLSCELRWHLMLQGSQEMLTLLEEDGTIRFCLAPIGTEGFASRDGDRKRLVDVVHPDDRGIVDQVFAELVADPDSSIAFQARLARGTDGWRWFESLATNLLEEPLIGAIVVNSLDVTDWKRLQEQQTQTA